jgi:TolA-binding protein
MIYLSPDKTDKCCMRISLPGVNFPVKDLSRGAFSCNAPVLHLKKTICILVFLSIVFAAKILLASDNPVDAANILFANGKYKEAIDVYARVKATYPSTDWAVMSYLMTARAYEKTGKLDDADAEYKAIINKYPKSGIAEEAFFAVARIRSAKGSAANAIKAYESYLKTYPMGQYRVMALFNTAALYKDKGDAKNALSVFGQILKDYPSEQWFYSWSAIYSGHIYMGKKDYDNAIESYQRVINRADNKFLYNLSALFRGQAFMEKKDYKTAIAIFQKLLQENNYFAEEALYGMGKAHYKAGEFEPAKESFETMLELFPETVWKSDVTAKLKTIEKRIKTQREAEQKADLKAGNGE